MVGVDGLRLGLALEREIPDGVVHIRIIRGPVEKFAPGFDGLGIPAGVHEIAGALDRRFLLIRSHAHSLIANTLAYPSAAVPIKSRIAPGQKRQEPTPGMGSCRAETAARRG